MTSDAQHAGTDEQPTLANADRSAEPSPGRERRMG